LNIRDGHPAAETATGRVLWGYEDPPSEFTDGGQLVVEQSSEIKALPLMLRAYLLSTHS